MLIFRYLLRETLKSSTAVFLVLMAIFILQKFVRVLAEASSGDIPAGLVLGFLALNIPVLASLILPLGLFLGIMLAHGRLYVDNEMAVMQACGISEWYVTRVMLVLSLILAALSAGLTLWLAPHALDVEYQLEEQLSAESGLTSLIPGRFQETGNQKAVLFVHEVSGEEGQLQRVFLAQQQSPESDQPMRIIYADTGEVEKQADGSEQLILKQGRQYEGQQQALDYRIIEFDRYQVQITEQSPQQQTRKLAAYSTPQLLQQDTLEATAEWQWRLAIPLSLPLLVLIAVPLSAVNPRQGRFGKLFPGLLLYLGYFMLLMAGRKVLENGKVPEVIGLWWVHGVVLVIGVVLVMKGRTTGVRLRARMKGGQRV
ncbi:Lipopolysaccharide export system permease protein LptF [Saliniradius amylolyticus]|uniref:Lipopolysaccharide export system permease protein LptF n=1 Tax=Saliniradius amylolyticus TaxID=2183582 RepID=A0A2S2E676_9ALTE|nr:LPS export ABC transporter permease LptF [Saliniradius amylolyticus]AWL13151.1 Lipopolysaccharide export system permease protein LptF [Saliniradius amylolyticus]